MGTPAADGKIFGLSPPEELSREVGDLDDVLIGRHEIHQHGVAVRRSLGVLGDLDTETFRGQQVCDLGTVRVCDEGRAYEVRDVRAWDEPRPSRLSACPGVGWQ